jgi:hypothetical protein
MCDPLLHRVHSIELKIKSLRRSLSSAFAATAAILGALVAELTVAQTQEVKVACQAPQTL